MAAGALTDQKILLAAERLFFEQGYQRTTLQELLDTLQCTKEELTGFYPTKAQILRSWCQLRVADQFSYYQMQQYETLTKRLNGLVECGMPFAQDNEKIVALLTPLVHMPEGNWALESLMSAEKHFFFPEMCRLLSLMQAAGTVHYNQPLLPELIWDTYTTLYQKLLLETEARMKERNNTRVSQWIDAERFLWERLLDIPYGTMTLVRCDAVLQTMDKAIARLQKQENLREEMK